MRISEMTWRAMVLTACCGALVASCRSASLSPEAPRALADALPTTPIPALPPLPPSVVDAPITYNLTSAIVALEQSVPRRFGKLDRRLVVRGSKRLQVAFHATRTPFTVAFDGRRITLTTVVTYQGRGWYNPPFAPTLGSSCGTDGPAPRLRIVLSADVQITPSWTLISRTAVRSVTPLTDTPRDQCQVTPFRVNVTENVTKAVRGALRGSLAAVDRHIAAFDVHTPVERWYNLLNRSVHIRDSLWLTLAPEGAMLGEIALRDSALVVDVRLHVRPAIVYGRRPARAFTPLPPFSRAANTIGDSVLLRLEGVVTYDDASAVLTSKLAGRTFRRLNRSVAISNVRIYGINDGRVVVNVAVVGDIVGHAYFVGTPKLDPVERTLTVPDLDFDVGTSDALVQGLAWLRKGDIVAELRTRTRIPLGQPLESLRSAAEAALERELTAGVRLSGRIHTGRMIDVVAHTRGIVVRAEATGSLALRVDRALKRDTASARAKAR